MLLATTARYYLEEFTIPEMRDMLETDMAKALAAINFTMQFKETCRRFRRKIPADSPALTIIREVEQGMTALVTVANEVHRDAPGFCSLEAWARRDLDNKFLEKQYCAEDGEWEIIKYALNAIRTRLELREQYEDCAKVRDTAKEIGMTKLLELIEKR
jgi:hypothetical protein